MYGLFAAHSLPGNIGQLRNVIRASAVLAGEKANIELGDLPEALRRELGLDGALIEAAGETPLDVAS